VYRVWQELKFYLDVFGNQSSISMKSVAEIYEVWCFLCLKQILEQNLGFTLVDNGAVTLSQNDFFEYQLKDGFAGAFRFKRSDGVIARLAHEPKFTQRGNPIRSYLVSQEPDIVLEVTLPKTSLSDEEKQFIWLFDAKYRIKTDKNRLDDSSEDITTTDYVPDDAINQMHRYRDALIRLSGSEGTDSDLSSPSTTGQPVKKSRPVFGAFALYPGFFVQTQRPNPYAAAIEEVGIGAFALLPSQADTHYCGHHWLLEFLQAQIGPAPTPQTGHSNAAIYSTAGIAERLYVQEAARIPYYGMRQVLYPDLTLTAALGGQSGRSKDYFKAFEQGTARWYHLPLSTFLEKFKQHVAEEIRYLALASTSDTQHTTKQIDKLWPVKSVAVVPRKAITAEQAGKEDDSTELYYLFELGKPLALQSPVTQVPHRPIKDSMTLTTLTRLESVARFGEVKSVYEEAMT
ncbi:MAG: nuclease domain-containing protein, partial [Shewanella sp.]